MDRIADREQELFSKPVHTKILTDLAVDPNFDLDTFSESFSKWSLYREFIESIYNREAEKAVRRDISTNARIRFIGEVAFWLWTTRGGAVSFSLEELPAFDEFENYADIDDPEEIERIQREFLSGSILEKKDGDNFYFGHRSFAEYLVADRMLSEPPSSAEHAKYALAIGDGVVAFLDESGRDDDIRSWAKTLGDARGEIDLRYISFLADRFEGPAGLARELSPNSFWRNALMPFEKNFVHSEANYKSAMATIEDTNPTIFAWIYCWLAKEGSYKWRGERFDDERGYGFDYRVIQCLINSFFNGVRRVDKSFTTNSNYVGFRRICTDAIEVFDFSYGNEVQYQHQKLYEACRKELERSGIFFEETEHLAAPPINLAVEDVVEGLSHPARSNFDAFAKYARRFNHVTEVAVLPKKRSDTPHGEQNKTKHKRNKKRKFRTKARS
ncbi:MAG: hypothetical protein AAF991_12500 [Pseudomonadota bacterium]